MASLPHDVAIGELRHSCGCAWQRGARGCLMRVALCNESLLRMVYSVQLTASCRVLEATIRTMDEVSSFVVRYESPVPLNAALRTAQTDSRAWGCKRELEIPEADKRPLICYSAQSFPSLIGRQLIYCACHPCFCASTLSMSIRMANQPTTTMKYQAEGRSSRVAALHARKMCPCNVCMQSCR